MGQCAFCQKPVDGRVRFCPHCGAEMKKTMPKTPGSCPLCRQALRPEKFRNQTVGTCSRCQGMWLDASAFRVLTSMRDTLADPTLPDFQRRPLPQKEAYRPCAQCGALMNKKNFKQISGVLVDVCRDHGIWLDAGELHALRSFIVAGGGEEALERRLDHQENDLRMLDTQLDETRFMLKLLHFWNRKRITFQGF